RTNVSHDTNAAPGGDITPTEFKRRWDSGQRPLLLDIREAFEWDIANLEPYGARHIPLAELPRRLDDLDRETEIVVHCRSGTRSERVVRYLRASGFTNARNLRGGILAWSDEVDPRVEKY
ncbi:MAG: rhodanese-like domain-containing protein, partial [Longimicrobiales bacterium]